MTNLGNLLLLVIGLLPLACNCCKTQEEGTDWTLKCGALTSSIRQSITMQVFQNGQFVNLSTCNVVDGTCQDFFPDSFNSYLTSDPGNRTTHHLHVKQASRNQATFQCLVDERPSQCTLDVFVTPTKPTCSDPVLSDDKVIVTCRTEVVYPSALCLFQQRGELEAENIASGDILYTTSDSTVSPGNKATECRLTIPVVLLPRKYTQFRVVMISNVKDTSEAYVTESDYTCPFVKDAAYAPREVCTRSSSSGVPANFGTHRCLTLEEGQPGYFACSVEKRSLKSSFGLLLYQNGHLDRVTSCDLAGQCQNSLPDVFTTQFTLTADGRVEQRADFQYADRNRNIFACGIDNWRTSVCRVDIFVNPATPTCDSPVLSADGAYVIVKCRTSNVYPAGRCLFREEATREQLRGEIHYLDTVSPVNSNNRATECTLLLPKGSLAPGSHQFRVFAFADVVLSKVQIVPSEATPPIQI